MIVKYQYSFDHNDDFMNLDSSFNKIKISLVDQGFVDV